MRIIHLPKHLHAYTLVELTVVLLVLSLAVAVMMPLITQEALRAKNAQMLEKLDVLEKALKSYRVKNNRLPCPAGFTDAVSAASFAVAAGSAGSCTGVSSGSCGGSPYMCRLSANVVSGIIPVRTLGLPDEALFDPWGRRMDYAVDERMTATNAFTTYTPKSATGAIEMRDESDTPRAANAIAVLIGHGANGHGAYTRAATRISESVTNIFELSNCNCTNVAADGTIDAIFYQRASTAVANRAADTFDDAVRYYTRGSFLTPADAVVTP